MIAKLDERIGEWRLRRKIASGGQGDIHAATRGEGGEEFAIKIIKVSRPKKRARFIREVSAHAKLSEQHADNILPLIEHNLEELEKESGIGFVVMPMACASIQSKIDLLAGRVELCLEIFEGVVNGIRKAHEAGVVHRDIKPGNVLFLHESLKEPLVSDFGVCFLKDRQEDEDRVTDAGETVGARYFMAPEQERGGRVDVGPSADIYALGKLLHHMLTGRNMYREELDSAFAPEELAREPRLSIIKERILAKTIVQDPARRLQTADDLLKIVRAVRGEVGGSPRGNGGGGVGSPPGTSERKVGEGRGSDASDLAAEYRRLKGEITGGQSGKAALEFDECHMEFVSKWEPIYKAFREAPNRAKEAAEELIRSQPHVLALSLAMARCDAEELFHQFKRFLEFVTKTSEMQSGNPAVFTTPHIQAGYLYMSSSVVAMHFESWRVLKQLLTREFERYDQSLRPLYSLGFDHPQFFHAKALGGSAVEAHEFFRKLMGLEDIAAVTGLKGEPLTNTYVQCQMIMSLRAAQLQQRDQFIRAWPDFGRFDDIRVIPLLDRMSAEPEYARGILEGFDESPDVFFAQLGPRLEVLERAFEGSHYWWNSLTSWEAR